MALLFKPQWTYDLHHRPNRWSIISPTLAVVSERRTWLACLDPTTGQVCWDAYVGTAWGQLASTSQWIVHCGATIQCFDREQGTLAWKYDPGVRFLDHLVASARIVLTGGWRGYMPLRCLDTATGEVRWIYPDLRVMTCPLLGSWGIAVIDHGEATSPTAATLLLMTEEGTVWRTLRMPEGVKYADMETAIQAYDDCLLAVTPHGSVFILNPRQDEEWIHVGTHLPGITTIAPIRSGNTLIIRDGDGHVCAYDLHSGMSRWIGPIVRRQYGYSIPAIELPDGRWVIGAGIGGQVLMLASDGVVLGTQTITQRITTAFGWTTNGLLVTGTKGTLSAYALIEAGDASSER